MKTYIAEIAGKDSISAIHKIMYEKRADFIIPTIVYTGTEYGNLSSYDKSIDYLIKCGKTYGVIVGETVTIHDETLWNYICIKYQNLIFSKYGFFTPCIMCHFFTHLLRIPLYLKKGCDGIITGERYSHMGKIKANQQYDTIRCFHTLFKRYEILLVQPLLNIDDTNTIDIEIKDYINISTINDVKCILSGNMAGFSLSDDKSLYKLRYFLNTFVEPVGDYLLRCYTKNEQIQYETLDNIIRSCLYE